MTTETELFDKEEILQYLTNLLADVYYMDKGSKKPKRELRVGNPFASPETTDQPAEPIRHITQETKQTIQLSAQTICLPPAKPLKDKQSQSLTSALTEEDKKKAKFEALRQKYLKKTSVESKVSSEVAVPSQPKSEANQPVTTNPVAILPAVALVIKEQVAAKPLPPTQPAQEVSSKHQQTQASSAVYRTDFRTILEEVRRDPNPKSELQKPAVPKDPFDLKATYSPSLPIKEARSNMNAAEPLTASEAVDSQPPVQAQPVVQPIDLSKLQHVSQHLLTDNPSEMLAQMYRYGYIPETTYEYLCQQILGTKYQTSQRTEIQYNSNNKAMEPWVRTLFQKFVLESESVQQRNYQTVWEFLSEFFPPLGAHLSTIFVVVMIKLSPEWYKQYENELVVHCLHYLQIAREHSTFIELKKREEFATYLLVSLHKHLKGAEYCRAFVHICSEFPGILKDEHLLEFDKQCKQFEWAACVYLLLSKHPSKLAGKGALNNLIYVVNNLEEKGYLQSCVAVLDATAIMGPSAYPVMRELRARVIGKLEVRVTEAKKNSKGGLFGFFNQAIQKISNSIPGKEQSHQPSGSQPAISKVKGKTQPNN